VKLISDREPRTDSAELFMLLRREISLGEGNFQVTYHAMYAHSCFLCCSNSTSIAQRGDTPGTYQHFDRQN